MRWGEVARAWLHEFQGILFPRGCAGCGKPDEICCSNCQSLLLDYHKRAVPVSVCESGYVYACGLYTGSLRHMILQWKDGQDRQCEEVLCNALGTLAQHVSNESALCASHISPYISAHISIQDGVTAYTAASSMPESTGQTIYVVVPVPSSPKSLRKRGRWQTRACAHSVTLALQQCGICAIESPLLAMSNAAQKSVGHRGQSRVTRLSGALYIRKREWVHLQHKLASTQRHSAESLEQSVRILLVDDIYTTGSTIRACSALVQQYGLQVVTALTIAMVPHAEVVQFQN